MLTRRNLLKTTAGVLVAAPAIVQASSLMKIFAPNPLNQIELRVRQLDLQLDMIEKAWASANIAIEHSMAQILAYQQLWVDKMFVPHLAMDMTKKYEGDVVVFRKHLDTEFAKHMKRLGNCK